ncbi:hypothetical protein BM536_022590 [Streptomyces phaeoluteigriseus]|uniref:Secreted protein n=1 Tax=Streptomyces phaeoluteigriseus TaxID=114686 RepID=A0A1V6MQH1_9ACTN|nr:hypothetical protein BM536_022590 [Streptomyces phaeoluteigriseus]
MAATGSALALSASPAFAGSNAHGYSYFESCGIISCVTLEPAEGWFYHDGDDWKVCDLMGDGDRAMISIYWEDSGGSHYHRLAATGGANTCVSGGAGVNIPEGKKVTLLVWHQNGADGSPKHQMRYFGTA